MAALTTGNPTLLDLAMGLDPDGSVADVVEILNLTNEVLPDMAFMEANETTGHVSTIRSGLPDPTWRKLYGGVQPTKSTRVKVRDACGMLEAYSEIDKKLADMSGDLGKFLLSESKAHIEAMSQEMAQTLFTGNESTAPEEFTGLAPRFNSSTAENACNMISGSSTDATANASIWLIGWSPETVCGIFPKGSKAGITVEDKGQVTIEDATGSSGGRMEAYRTHFTWDMGLCVRDWRYIARGYNIDRSALKGDAASGPDLLDIMDQMIDVIPSLTNARFGFYMDRSLLSFVRRQAKAATAASTLSIETLANGQRITTYSGIPLRRTDALSADEALIS